MYRLDPGVVPFRKATQCKIHVSGGEFNVAANLANCFGIPTGIASAMVDYPIGDLIAERVRAMGVQPFYKRFEHNGVTGPNMATVYSDRGYGVRPPVVFYNRANEAGAMLKPGDFDWKAIFAGGVRWFHSGGIFAAFSPTTGDLIVEAMQAAKAVGRGGFFRPQLSREAVECLGRRRPRQGPCCAASFKMSTCWWATKKIYRQALGMAGAEEDRQDLSATEDRGHQPARSAFGQPAHLERHGLDRRANLFGAEMRIGCLRSRGRRRWILGRILLRAAGGRISRRCAQAGLGARRAVDYFSRRHNHGDAGSSARVRSGRVGSDSALS